jgi:hypothetical protein
MFLSKIWFVLVGLVAALALTAAFVAPRPADRRVEQLEGQRLDRAQYAAEQMLKTDAHRWIDYVAKLGRDVIIAEALESATSGKGEARMIHETVRGRMRTLVPDLQSIGLETMVAVDNQGRVVARLGEHENDYGDSVSGAEVVADALRGYASDDVWGAGGRLRRIAAAPVLARTHDKIVGAVFVGAETAKRLADLWKKNLGVDIAVLLRKQILSATLPEALLGQLPDMIEAKHAEIAEAHRSRPLPLPAGDDRLLAVAAPFTGEATDQDAYYVLIGKMAPTSNPWALLSSAAADDLRWGNFPWLGLGAAVIIMLGVGLALQRYEIEAPVERLRTQLKRVVAGDIQKIDDHTFHGKFGGVARDMNAALERFTHAVLDAGRSETSRKDINAILDSGVPESRGFDLPYAGGASPYVPPSPGSSAFPASPGPFASPGSPFAAAPPAAPAPPPPAYATFDRERQGRPLPPIPLKPGLPAPLPPLSPMPSLSPPSIRNAISPSASSSSASLSDAATVVERPGSPGPFTGEPVAVLEEPVSGGFGAELAPDDTTNEMRGGADKIRTVDIDADEAHIRTVFLEYVAARRQTGEANAAVTLDKFRAKLAANRAQLIAKYGCRTARFSVYVKDGKAAIRATPVRD